MSEEFNFCSLSVTFCSFLSTQHSLTNQRTNSMEQSPSWEANSFSASQENFLVYHLNVHKNILKSPLPVPVLSKIEASPLYSLEIHFYIIHGPDPYPLYTFHLPNLISNFHSLHQFLTEVLWNIP